MSTITSERPDLKSVSKVASPVNSSPSQWMSDAENVLDNFFRDKIDSAPGVALAIVKDGETLIRGYGWVDRENRRLVDANENVFHVGSLAEVFTSIAIMQLVERGKIKLEDDVNKYLKAFQINSPRPIAVAHLLTQTDGFDERTRAIMALSPYDIHPLEDILAIELKAPFIEPGQMITHGRWGMALAGYIVQEVSGLSFARYAEQNIFIPLDMQDSTFQAILPKELWARFATVYANQGGSHEPIPFLYTTTPPVDGLTTSAPDMARFMTALLNGGSVDGSDQILMANTLKDMFRTRFANFQDMPGVTYGFMEHWENDQRALVRDGTGLGVRSRMLILPDQNMGLFVVCNTRSSEVCEKLTTTFFEHFFPAASPAFVPQDNSTYRGQKYAGAYRYVQVDKRTFARLQSLNTGNLEVSNNGDGSLTLRPFGGEDPLSGFTGPARLLPTGQDNVFRREDNGGQVVFKEDANGLITNLFSGRGYHGCYSKLPTYDAPRFAIEMLIYCIAAFVIGLGIWGLRVLLTPSTSEGWGAALFAVLVSVLNLVFAIGVFTYLRRRVAGFPPFVFIEEAPRWFRALFTLPVVNTLLSVGVLFYAGIAWQVRFWTGIETVFYSLFAIAAIAFLWLLNRWNLLGFRF